MSQKPLLRISADAAEKGLKHFHHKGNQFNFVTASNPQQLDEGVRRLVDWELQLRVFLTDAFTTTELADHVRTLISILETGDLSEETYPTKFYKCYSAINDFLSNLIHTLAVYEIATPTSEATDIVERICLRFDHLVRQLRHRYKNRPALAVIEDEYDVQDLLHGLLRVFFDDVRAEDPAPMHAGAASRLDFVLKKERIVIEVKKTRPTLREKELGEQLITDIERYKSHADCKTLYCLVYDPDHYINNPVGIENDLSRTNPFPVRVIISPKS